MSPTLYDVNVHLWIITRVQLDQGGAFIDWWIGFLSDSGATMKDRTIFHGNGSEVELVIAEKITG